MRVAKTIEAVFFDIGGVLVSVDSSRAMEALSQRLDVSPDQIRQAMSFELLNNYEKGLLTSNQFYEELLVACNSVKGMDLETFKAFWQDVLFPKPDSIAVLEKFSAHLPVYLLSNTNDFHYELLMRDFPFMKGVTGGTYSFMEGTIKPEARIYEIAIQRSGFRPEQILFIDDLQANVLAGKEMGLQVIHFTDFEHFSQELQLRFPDLGAYL
jgi:putative hydrolase of the HAD superfamily